ncbi:hypothetical protein F4776DRAFT_443320 [Hypoxylon sp. NC0597]|nr:hypothetical protein F4776DRAFT_443320 [Hypoxylon sp. NC0597]
MTMSNNVETASTSPPDFHFFVRYFEERKSAFFGEIEQYGQDPKKFETEDGVVKRGSNEEFDLSDNFIIATASIGIDCPTISLFTHQQEKTPEYARLYEGIIFAGHVLEPYFGYYRIVIHTYDKEEEFSILPRHLLLPTSQSGCYVHWKWGDQEQLDRYKADPLAEWKSQCSDDKIPYRDSPGLDWSRGIVAHSVKAWVRVASPLRFIQGYRMQLHRPEN